ncbi:unnamed protein product [Urochloa humidicola]
MDIGQDFLHTVARRLQLDLSLLVEGSIWGLQRPL